MGEGWYNNGTMKLAFRLTTCFLVLLSLFFVPAFDSYAAWLWSPESGKWTNLKDAPKDSPEHQFAVAQEFYDKKDYARAADELDKLIQTFPNTRWAAESQFHKGVCYEGLGDIGKAAESFKILVERYPYSERVNDAIEHEFELAEAMMEGKKTKFLGMAIIPAKDKAADLYRHIVKSAPFGPYGAVAQFRLAEAELALGNYEESERAFQAVIDDYPTSEYAPKAKFRIAEVSYQTAIKEETHVDSTDKALENMEGFKTAYPESHMKYEADEAIKNLREQKAQSVFDVAAFYHRRKKFKSAQVYYQDVVQNYPDTEAATRAIEHLKQIDGSVWKDTESKQSANKKKWFGLF